MVQRRDCARLLLKPSQAGGIFGRNIVQDLDRDIAVQLRIPRAINLAHSACTEGREYLVLAEHRTRSQGHSPDYILLSERSPFEFKGAGTRK